MQTFLPYPEFDRTARALDPRRLGNQRSEALVVLRVLHIPTYGWQHHPAVRMWRGHDEALIAYGVSICTEWTARGHRDTVRDKLLEYSRREPAPEQAALSAEGRLPPWLGEPALHRSHQSALLRKDPEWYGPLFPGVPDDLPYWWPPPS
jgi:hypothetical protein